MDSDEDFVVMNAQQFNERITRNPGIFGGKPIIRGTRITVELIHDLVSAGETPEQVVDDYPVLTLEDIHAALAFVSHGQDHIETRPWRATG